MTPTTTFIAALGGFSLLGALIAALFLCWAVFLLVSFRLVDLIFNPVLVALALAFVAILINW